MSKYLKAMFNQMKGFGLFKDFESYEQWKEIKFGEKETIKDFKDTLNKEEKKQYNFMFGEK